MKPIGVALLVVLSCVLMTASFTGAKDSGTVVVGNKRWLKNANCWQSATWDGAQSAAAALKDGVCGLADGSKAGDWRAPTIAELKAMCVNQDKFTGVVNTGYWSNQTKGLNAAYFVVMLQCADTYGHKGNTFWVTAVKR